MNPPELKIFTEDLLDGAPGVPNGSVDVIFTSPPYKKKDGYSPELMKVLGQACGRVLRPGGRMFMNFGQLRPEGFGRPYEAWSLVQEHSGLVPGQTISWVKSAVVLSWRELVLEEIATKPWEGGGYALIERIKTILKGAGKRVQRGHYTPIVLKSPTLNYGWEPIFTFYKPPELALNRLAIGVGFTDKCLSVYTEIVARVSGEVRISTLGRAKAAFDKGEKVELPSWDFGNKRTAWSRVTRFSEPKAQDVLEIRLRNGAAAMASAGHRFPVYKHNTRSGREVLDCMTMQGIAIRAQSQPSRRVPLYYAPAMTGLLDEGAHALYGYDTGYAIGLFLAEGSHAGGGAVRFAAHVDEDQAAEFGGFLDHYFGTVYGTPVYRYPGSSSGGIQFHAHCVVFRALLEGLVRGNLAKTKCLRMSKCLKHGAEFLRGIVDGFLVGDGSLAGDRYTVGICENRRLVENLRVICLLVGYEFRQNADTTTRAFGGEFLRVNFWVRKHLGGVRRKPKDNGLVTENLDSVSPCQRAVRTLDVEVESEHNLFFLANGMMTHNSNLKRGTRGKHGDLHCAGDVWFVPYKTTGAKKKKATATMGSAYSFPVELPLRAIKLCGLKPESVVFDPFAGSGTTLVAARRLGMHAWGIEIDPANVPVIEQRWKEVGDGQGESE